MNWNFIKDSILKDDFIIDCRLQASYEEETASGAHFFTFIKKAYGTDNESQRKMSGNIAGIMDLIEKSGCSRVIVFDEGMGMYASRMVYFLREAGFRETFLLGKKWPMEGLKTAPGTSAAEFEPSAKPLNMNGIADKAYMEKNLTRLQIFDTRTKEEYDGKLPRLNNPENGTLCGRLPGAFLWDWRTFFDMEGFIIEKAVFTRRLQGFPFMPERTTVLYDYNGARSCLPALMLKEVGYQDVKTYQGSWYEWRKTSLPKQAVSLYGTENKSNSAPRVGGLDRKK